MANTALDGKPYAGNPHVRIDEGDGASAKPRRSSLLYKSTFGEFKVRKGIVLLTLFALTLAVSADIALPPKPLQRIGFEIFTNNVPASADATENRPDARPDENVPLTEDEKNDLEKWIAQLKALFRGKERTILADGRGAEYEAMEHELRANFRKLKAFDNAMRKGGENASGGWKCFHQVSLGERGIINIRIFSVKNELQVRFDSEYAKMEKDGKLEKIEPWDGKLEYLYLRYKRRVAQANAMSVLKSVFEQDEGARQNCIGIPIEWLIRSIECPDPALIRKPEKGFFQCILDWFRFD